MRFDYTKVYNFSGAFRGMRNPKNSWSKSDSQLCSKCCNAAITDCPLNQQDYTMFGDSGCFILGEEDLKLAQKLIRAGSEHRKFMRQILVSVDITAPLYWWKEFDTYKVGTVSNSTSTMHTLESTPITIDCFETDDFNFNIDMSPVCKISNVVNEIIAFLEGLRNKFIETKDKQYWKELIRWLPDSWLQTRTVTMTYENLYAMCSKGQRRFHKLNEWSGIVNPNTPNFIAWARKLPYASELIFLDETAK